jgi:hypothetical protein
MNIILNATFFRHQIHSIYVYLYAYVHPHIYIYNLPHKIDQDVYTVHISIHLISGNQGGQNPQNQQNQYQNQGQQNQNPYPQQGDIFVLYSFIFMCTSMHIYVHNVKIDEINLTSLTLPSYPCLLNPTPLTLPP